MIWNVVALESLREYPLSSAGPMPRIACVSPGGRLHGTERLLYHAR